MASATAKVMRTVECTARFLLTQARLATHHVGRDDQDRTAFARNCAVNNRPSVCPSDFASFAGLRRGVSPGRAVDRAAVPRVAVPGAHEGTVVETAPVPRSSPLVDVGRGLRDLRSAGKDQERPLARDSDTCWPGTSTRPSRGPPQAAAPRLSPGPWTTLTTRAPGSRHQVGPGTPLPARSGLHTDRRVGRRRAFSAPYFPSSAGLGRDVPRTGTSTVSRTSVPPITEPRRPRRPGSERYRGRAVSRRLTTD